jgi:hypothetical protein
MVILMIGIWEDTNGIVYATFGSEVRSRLVDVTFAGKGRKRKTFVESFRVTHQSKNGTVNWIATFGLGLPS